jgi:hypothetical protein
MLYEIKTSYVDLMNESKPAKDHYIVDAELFAQAENIGYDLYSAEEQADVVAVFRSDIREIINEKTPDKPYFRATVVEVTSDEFGKEKTIKYPMLVCAKDLTEANAIVSEYLKQGYDMRLDALRRVKIKDYIKDEPHGTN